MTQPHRRRLQRRRRRRLIAAVVIIDVVGAGGLAFALSRSSPSTSNDASLPVLAPQAAATGTPQTTRAVAAASRSAAPQRAARRAHRSPAGPRPQSDSPSDAQASFARLAAGLPGSVGVAIAPLGAGPVRTFGTLHVGRAWSTMKVPVLTAVLGELEQRGEVLGPQGQAEATAALEHSDNAAADALFSELERTRGGLVGASSAVQQTLHAAGDDNTIVNTAPNSGGFTTWGQSEWSDTGEVAFYRSLARGCLLTPSDNQYVLHLMRSVESDQRWGAGSAGFPADLPLAFKGGWGPESGAGYLVRQTAIVGSGSRGYVFSMLARPSNGEFAAGTQLLTQIAAWVARTFPPTVTRPATSCG